MTYQLRCSYLVGKSTWCKGHTVIFIGGIGRCAECALIAPKRTDR